MRKLGRYQLIRKLATGGMAELYLARMEGPGGFEKQVALKVILPHLADDPRFLQMLLTEARLAAQLSHPNIIHIFDFGVDDSTYFLAMERIDGADCRLLVRESARQRRPIPLTLAAKIIALGCEGLHFAHSFVNPATGEPMNIVHRDMSADNLLVSRSGAVKVIDFGVAKLASTAQSSQTGQLKGKFAYTSPEQFRGEPLDGRSDVFSLGMILYELIAGRKPFDTTFDAAVMQAVMHGDFPPLKSFRPDVPDELQAIVDHALEKKRNARYASCLEFAQDLEAFIAWAGESVGSFHLAGLVNELVGGDSLMDLHASGATPPSGMRAVSPLGRPEKALAPEFDTWVGKDGETEMELPVPRKRYGGAVAAFVLGLLVTAGCYSYWFERPVTGRVLHSLVTRWPGVTAKLAALASGAKAAVDAPAPGPPPPAPVFVEDAGGAQEIAKVPEVAVAPVDAGEPEAEAAPVALVPAPVEAAPHKAKRTRTRRRTSSHPDSAADEAPGMDIPLLPAPDATAPGANETRSP